jgi:hypothetical protein
MLAALDREHFVELKQKQLEFVSQYPLINAVLSGLQRGFVYADNAYDSFFVCTKFGFSLFRAPDDEAFSQYFLDFLLKNKDIPEYIHFYCAHNSFEKHLAANWPKYKVRRRAQFRNYQQDRSFKHGDLLPPGFGVATAKELEFELLESALRLDLGHRYWNSKEDFLTAGLGACIVDQSGTPVAICYAACVVNGIAEVDILVLPEHRGKKLMRIVCGACLDQTVAQNLVAHWDAFVENRPSYLMAQKFGLTLTQEYDLLSLFLR